jgi:hypothetical protein
MTSLKNILLLNAVSSAATGVGLLVFARFMADIFGVSQLQAFYGTGIFLLVFAGMVFYEALKSPIRPNRVLFISVLDAMWVIVSATIVVLGLFNLSLVGYGLISAVALWVGAMAYLQLKGIKQLSV